LRWLSTLALAAVSRKLTSVITSVGSTSWPSVCQPGQRGRYSAGRPCGSAPTTAPPPASKPIAQLSVAASTTITSTPGKVGFQRRPSISSASAPRPKALASGSTAGWCSISAQPARKPSSAGSCEPMISTAAAWVKAMSTGALTRFSSQPKRTSPSTTCSKPASSASHTASATHSALPGVAMGVSAAAIIRLVSAVGPTDSRAEAENSTATSAGSMEA
jgi:hypothetical protein